MLSAPTFRKSGIALNRGYAGFKPSALSGIAGFARHVGAMDQYQPRKNRPACIRQAGPVGRDYTPLTVAWYTVIM